MSIQILTPPGKCFKSGKQKILAKKVAPARRQMKGKAEEEVEEEEEKKEDEVAPNDGAESKFSKAAS